MDGSSRILCIGLDSTPSGHVILISLQDPEIGCIHMLECMQVKLSGGLIPTHLSINGSPKYGTLWLLVPATSSSEPTGKPSKPASSPTSLARKKTSKRSK